MSLKQLADDLLRSATESGDVPGVAAMVTDREGAFYEGAFGKRVLGHDEAMSVDTVAWIASMTKAITGAAAMQCVEHRRLDLDTPASRWLPELGEVKVLEGFDAAGEPRLRAPRQPITLRHLMTHSAGFGYEMWSEDIVRYQAKMGLPGIISCQNAALKLPLLFDPGERWNYGINLDYVGKLVEAVSGKRLGEYFAEHLFGPLGMNDTAFRITPAMRTRLAKIHQRGDDGQLTALMELEVPQEPEFEMGGGGLYSTAADYLKFVRLFLNGGHSDNGERVLAADTVGMMERNQMGPLRVGMLKTAIPALSKDAEFFPGLPKSWGLSFMINEEQAPTGRPAGSLAWAGLANSYYWIDRRNEIAGVFVTQILPFVDDKAFPLYIDFEKTVYATR